MNEKGREGEDRGLVDTNLATKERILLFFDVSALGVVVVLVLLGLVVAVIFALLVVFVQEAKNAVGFEMTLNSR